MKLFVALEPPAAARADLAATIEETRAVAPDGLRWTSQDRWHLTLAFLGDVPDAQVRSLTDRLTAACAGGPLRLRLAGGGHFRSSVLWAGLAGDTRGLRVLAEAVRGAARAVGIATDTTPYRPHLTVARAGRDRVRLDGAAAALAGYVGPTWTVATAHLIHSRLGAGPGGGAEHTVLAEFPLTGRRDADR